MTCNSSFFWMFHCILFACSILIELCSMMNFFCSILISVKIIFFQQCLSQWLDHFNSSCVCFLYSTICNILLFFSELAYMQYSLIRILPANIFGNHLLLCLKSVVCSLLFLSLYLYRLEYRQILFFVWKTWNQTWWTGAFGLLNS